MSLGKPLLYLEVSFVGNYPFRGPAPSQPHQSDVALSQTKLFYPIHHHISIVATNPQIRYPGLSLQPPILHPGNPHIAGGLALERKNDVPLFAITSDLSQIAHIFRVGIPMA